MDANELPGQFLNEPIFRLGQADTDLPAPHGRTANRFRVVDAQHFGHYVSLRSLYESRYRPIPFGITGSSIY